MYTILYMVLSARKVLGCPWVRSSDYSGLGSAWCHRLLPDLPGAKNASSK